MEIRLSDWQTTVWDDPHRFKVLNLGRRSGKTVLSVIKLIDVATTPKKTCWYISPTYRQSKSIAWQLLKEYLDPRTGAKFNESDLSVVFPNHSVIALKGADNPDSLRGTKIDFAIFDEVAFFTKWESVWQALRPILVDSKAPAWFVSTPNGFNHFKDLSESTDPEYRYYHFTSYANPYIDQKELDKIKLEMSEDAFAQEFLGEFRKMKGLIYKEFHRDTHMVDLPDLTGFTMTRALDFGFAHKTALIYFAIAPTGDRIYAFDGLYQSDYTIPQLAEAIKIKDAGKLIVNPVADSAQPGNIQELNNMGVSFSPVEKAPDSVKNGIVKVAQLIKIRQDTGKPTLMFSKSLSWIADEFERYRWVNNASSDDVIKEVPYKVDDDAMDAIRYFAMSYKQPTRRVLQYDPKKWSLK